MMLHNDVVQGILQAKNAHLAASIKALPRIRRGLVAFSSLYNGPCARLPWVAVSFSVFQLHAAGSPEYSGH